jgi:hypothetical protein
MTGSDPVFRAALRALREATCSADNRSLVSLLVRATALSPTAARVLVKNSLRTRSERREAVIAAAVAMAAEHDQRRARQ